MTGTGSFVSLWLFLGGWGGIVNLSTLTSFKTYRYKYTYRYRYINLHRFTYVLYIILGKYKIVLLLEALLNNLSVIFFLSLLLYALNSFYHPVVVLSLLFHFLPTSPVYSAPKLPPACGLFILAWFLWSFHVNTLSWKWLDK